MRTHGHPIRQFVDTQTTRSPVNSWTPRPRQFVDTQATGTQEFMDAQIREHPDRCESVDTQCESVDTQRCESVDTPDDAESGRSPWSPWTPRFVDTQTNTRHPRFVDTQTRPEFVDTQSSDTQSSDPASPWTARTASSSSLEQPTDVLGPGAARQGLSRSTAQAPVAVRS